MPDFGRWAANGGDPSLNEINRADRFFEALASKQPVYSTDPAEAELAFLFSEFRDDVRDAPVTAPVSAGDAVEALRGGLVKTRAPRRGFAIVGSVAAAMLCIGGFGTAVYGAGPGDSLYGVRTTIFGQQEQTRDDQVSLASAQLQQVQQLIDQGQWQQAQDKLVEVSSAVQGVDQVASKQQLVEQWNALTYKVVEQDPAATLPPGEPLPVLPSSPLTWLPVPVVQATTTESSVSTQTSEPTTSSETTVNPDSSGSTVPPETLMTAPPDSSTSSSSTTSSSSSTTSTASSSPPTAQPAAPPASSPAPSPPSTPPSSAPSPASPPPTRTTTAATTSVTSTPSKVPDASLAPSTSAVPEPTVSLPPSSASPSTAVAPSQPPASTPSERPSVATSTTIVPQSGGLS